MITIDKLCYHSKLRYENAGEKFAFAVITLCICSGMYCFSCDRDSGRLERRDPCFPLSAVSHSASGIFISEYHRHYVQYQKSASGSFCHTGRKLVYNRQYRLFFLCPAADPDCPGSCILPVLSVFYHAYAGYPGSSEKASLSGTSH